MRAQLMLLANPVQPAQAVFVPIRHVICVVRMIYAESLPHQLLGGTCVQVQDVQGQHITG